MFELFLLFLVSTDNLHYSISWSVLFFLKFGKKQNRQHLWCYWNTESIVKDDFDFIWGITLILFATKAFFSNDLYFYIIFIDFIQCIFLFYRFFPTYIFSKSIRQLSTLLQFIYRTECTVRRAGGIVIGEASQR